MVIYSRIQSSKKATFHILFDYLEDKAIQKDKTGTIIVIFDNNYYWKSESKNIILRRVRLYLRYCGEAVQRVPPGGGRAAQVSQGSILSSQLGW